MEYQILVYRQSATAIADTEPARNFAAGADAAGGALDGARESLSDVGASAADAMSGALGSAGEGLSAAQGTAAAALSGAHLCQHLSYVFPCAEVKVCAFVEGSASIDAS